MGSSVVVGESAHLKHPWVKVTLVRVVVAVAFLAFIPLLTKARPPRPVLEEGLAVLTVLPPEILN